MCVHQRFLLESFRNRTEQRQQCITQRRTAQRSLHYIRARDRVIGILVFVRRKHRHQHIKRLSRYERIPNLPRRIDRRLGSHYADGSLHLTRVRLSQYAVVIQVIEWLVDAIEILCIGEFEHLPVAETFRLIRFELPKHRSCQHREGCGHQQPRYRRIRSHSHRFLQGL